MDSSTRHVTVYRESGRYAGWPANYGVWSWGNEIVVGFTVGYMDLRPEAGFHARDRDKPFLTMQARSLDGGETWLVTPTPCRAPGGKALSADEHMRPALGVGRVVVDGGAMAACPGEVDFTHPDFALMCARTGLRAGAVSWFYLSSDNCRSWDGPFGLPLFGQRGIAARTDYQVSGPRECLLFLTATKTNGEEGRVFCARTVDAGRTFAFVSWVGPEPPGFAIMPASVRLSSSRLLVAVRCRDARRLDGSERNWIDLYRSDDDAETWHYAGRPVAATGRGGNPPALIRLSDGRLCLTYGYRDAPSGIRATIGTGGDTWGPQIVLRDDGGDHDVGYPRTVQRPDGKVVTIYYYNDHPLGERYIAATVWEP